MTYPNIPTHTVAGTSVQYFAQSYFPFTKLDCQQALDYAEETGPGNISIR